MGCLGVGEEVGGVDEELDDETCLMKSMQQGVRKYGRGFSNKMLATTKNSTFQLQPAPGSDRFLPLLEQQASMHARATERSRRPSL